MQTLEERAEKNGIVVCWNISKPESLRNAARELRQKAYCLEELLERLHKKERDDG